MKPLDEAIRRYALIAERVFARFAGRSVGFLSDPLFEGAKVWSCERLNGHISADQFSEVANAETQAIEPVLLQIREPYSLLPRLSEELRKVAPRMNQRGVTLFIGSWGMSAAEFGWFIRYINSRRIFDDYLRAAGLDEAEIDAYTETFTREIEQ